MVRKVIMVSACLMGDNITYNADNNFSSNVIKLSEIFKIIKFCPEQLGNLPTPREPSEIKSGDGFDVMDIKAIVVNKNGKDVTENFLKGAEETLKMAIEHKPVFIVLKECSPSCGIHNIYDGSFTNTLIKGCGITTALLIKNGYIVINENEVRRMLFWTE